MITNAQAPSRRLPSIVLLVFAVLAVFGCESGAADAPPSEPVQVGEVRQAFGCVTAGCPDPCTTCDPQRNQCVPVDCNDGDVCTSDSCSGGCMYTATNEGGACTKSGASGVCTSGSCCTGCKNQGCRPGNQPNNCGIGGGACKSCDDTNPCTTDGCDSNGNCTNTGVGNGQGCTVGGVNGLCMSASCCTGCWTGSACVAPGSVNAAQCGANGNSCTSCDDGNPCTTDSCSGGVCTHATLSQGVTCTAGGSSGICNLESGQTYRTCCTGCLNGSSCVTLGSESAGQCGKGGAACAVCDDSNVCTVNKCTAGTCDYGTATTPAPTCRGAVDECDVAETCSGTACPADGKATATSPCSSDGNPCTVDQCDGSSVSCTHPAGNAGTVCRAAAGGCDVAETCNGSSKTCPTDGFAASTVTCRNAAGPCDVAENCTGSSATCPADAFKPSTSAPCRPSAGVCDIAENCSGTGAACPADAFQSSTVSCRGAADVCDTAENCTGSSATCPSDGFKSNTVQCRAPSCGGTPATATLAANCSGAGASCPSVQTQQCSSNQCSGSVCSGGCSASNPCPANQYCGGGTCLTEKPDGQLCGGNVECANGNCVDGVCCNTTCGGGVATDCQACNLSGSLGVCTAVTAGTVCRAAAGVCDAAEACNGSSTACPADAKQSTSVVCRASAGACDVAEKCDGAANGCPTDFLLSGAPCRASAGECDVAETCDGTSAVCPTDVLKNANTACTDDGNPCTRDVCNGALASCTHSAGNAGTACRPAAGECDLAESCNGTSTACPVDQQKNPGTSCTSDGNPCTDDQCDGNSVTCQHPAGGAGTLCRAAAGECDLAETCNGSSTNCPPDALKTSGTTCTADALPCTSDVCNGTSVTCQHPAGNAGTICRATTGECDIAEACNGSSTQCPTDTKRQSGTDCTADANPCTLDQCDGAGTCGHPAGNAGSVCRPATGNCDAPEACTGTSATCPVDRSQPDGTTCTDGTVCNGAEVCKSGACTAGTALDCDDRNPCTADGCHPVNGCTHANATDGTDCDDGNPCSPSSSCVAGKCKGSSGPDCNDDNPCTTDGCDANSNCTHVKLTGGDCNDANACTQVDKCENGVCVGGSPVTCDDGKPCTDDKCDPQSGCGSKDSTNGTSCTDGNPCNGAETCLAGQCAAGTTADCDDHDPCTVDGCAGTGCTHDDAPDGTSCTDGNACNGAETCKSGKCTSGTPLPCDDKNPCTDDGCDPIAGGCTTKPRADGTSCSDGNLCNGVEVCQDKACKPGKKIDCDDGDPCTDDTCDGVLGCKHAPAADDTPCSDGSVCTQGDACKAGKCAAGKTLSCDDGRPCTVDSCDPSSGCAHVNEVDETACDDQNPCSNGDRCLAGDCVAKSGVICDDRNPCTKDSCVQGTTTCTYTNLPGGTACDDGDSCTGPDVCQSGTCQAGATLDCTDDNSCTDDSCSPSTGCAHSAMDGAGCADGNPCTVDDACVADVCSGATMAVCATSNDCHRAECTSTGICGPETAKHDGSSCENGACVGGVCTPGAPVGDGGTPLSDGGSSGGSGNGPDAGFGGAGGAPDAALGGGSGDGAKGGGKIPPERLFVRDPGGCSFAVGAPRNEDPLRLGLFIALGLSLVVRRRRSCDVARMLAAASLILLGLRVTPARAEADEQHAAARSLAVEGARACNEQRFKDCLDLFKRAESLVHAPPHLLYAARAEEHLGHLVKAREYYLRITHERLQPNAPQVFSDAQTAAAEAVQKIEPRISFLTIVLRGDGGSPVEVTLDGDIVPAALLGVARPVDPGEHHVDGKGKGLRAAPQTITLAEGTRGALTLTFERTKETPVAEAPDTPKAETSKTPAEKHADGAPSAADGKENGKLAIAAYGSFGLGVAGLAVGTIFGLKAKSDRKDADGLFTQACSAGCDKDSAEARQIAALDDRGRTDKWVSIVGFSVGGAGVAAGTVLFFLSRGAGHGTEEKAAVRVKPWVGVGRIGIDGVW